MTRLRHSISVIIPVLNERERINRTIDGLCRLAPAGPDQIIVVDGDPEGGTINAVARPEVITVRSGRGRGRQMNHGAALATGDILLFLHADTELPAHALMRIDEAAARCGAGAFELGVMSRRRVFRITERYVALRTRLTGIPFGDQAIFMRRSLFEQLGGYGEDPIMEDVELMKRLRKAGHSVAVIPEKVMTSPRRWEQEGLLYCTLRNWLLQAAYALGVPAHRLARWYK